VAQNQSQAWIAQNAGAINQAFAAFIPAETAALQAAGLPAGTGYGSSARGSLDQATQIKIAQSVGAGILVQAGAFGPVAGQNLPGLPSGIEEMWASAPNTGTVAPGTSSSVAPSAATGSALAGSSVTADTSSPGGLSGASGASSPLAAQPASIGATAATGATTDTSGTQPAAASSSSGISLWLILGGGALLLLIVLMVARKKKAA